MGNHGHSPPLIHGERAKPNSVGNQKQQHGGGEVIVWAAFKKSGLCRMISYDDPIRPYVRDTVETLGLIWRQCDVQDAIKAAEPSAKKYFRQELRTVQRQTLRQQQEALDDAVLEVARDGKL